MNDLISRRAAIDAFDTHADEIIISGEENARNVLNYLNKVIDTIKALPSAQPEQQHGRIFQEIVVEYPSISAYPERKGKPYFSIKYTENGQGFIGYGTYKPEVLSEYLKEYFMPSAQPDDFCSRAKRRGENDG